MGHGYKSHAIGAQGLFRTGLGRGLLARWQIASVGID
jgi:hypothetical protein